MLRRLNVAALIVAATSCGHPAARTEPRAIAENVIGAEELEATRQPTLFEALRVARPLWFTARQGGPEAILVYQDDQPFGGVDVLRRMSVSAASRVTYMPPSEAQLHFGPRNGMRPAIIVDSAR